MKETRLIMGMPITVDINGAGDIAGAIEKVFSYFTAVDERFSTYKEGSEISRINRGLISPDDYSEDMKEIFAKAERTKQETKGYFDIRTPGGYYDPSGIVKGWAIEGAAKILKKEGFENFYVEAGGDIQTGGVNDAGKPWRVGIRSPFNPGEIIKVVELSGRGIATSGTYVRGRHIYNPHEKKPVGEDVVSLTVIAENVYEADRYATAAFAMGKAGILFIDQLPGCEGYLVEQSGTASMTRGFHRLSKERRAARTPWQDMGNSAARTWRSLLEKCAPPGTLMLWRHSSPRQAAGHSGVRQ